MQLRPVLLFALPPILLFALRKLLRLGLLLLAVAVFTFVLLSLSPIDPLQAYIGADMMQISPEQRGLITLSIIGIANIALHTRQKLIDVLNSDYVLFARAQGESLAGVVRHHGLRNIILPALTLQFASLSELFGGSVLVEQVFAYPGLGAATVQAALRSDVPLLVGIVFFSALFVYTGNTLADLAYPLVDPRIRLACIIHDAFQWALTWPQTSQRQQTLNINAPGPATA